MRSLNLKKAIEVGQQYELSKKHVAEVRHKIEEAQVSAIKYKDMKVYKSDQNSVHTASSTNHTRNPVQVRVRCSKCGKNPNHSWSQGVCPAINSVCSFCRQKGHWQLVCRENVSVNQLVDHEPEHGDSVYPSEEPDDDVILCMYSLNPLSSQEDDNWSVNLQLEGCENKIIFKIDTGAKCNVISLHDYEGIQHGGKILPTNKILKSYSNHRIQPIGEVRLMVGTEKHSTTVAFLIVEIEQDSVISGATAEKLSH
jgi:hypothetical protein